MRRIVVTTALIAALAGAASAFASPGSTARRVVKPYVAATTAITGNGYAQGSGIVVDTGPTGPARAFGLVFAKVRSTDSRVSLRLTDQTGRTVQALVQQTVKNGSVIRLGVVCGASTKPLRLAPGGGTLIVRPSYGTCGTTPSVPTTGTVALHFTG